MPSNIVATFSIHDESVRLNGAVIRRPAKWRVAVFVRSADGEQVTDYITNRQPCRLPDMIETAKEKMLELLDQFEVFSDAGFQVVLLR